MSAQSYNFCWTYFDVDETQRNHPTWGDSGMCSLERCPDTGKLHFQGVSHFEKKLTVKAARKIFGKTHFEICKGTYAQNVTYCSEDDTHVAGPFSWGPPVLQGARTDLESACEAVRVSGVKRAAELHPSVYVKYYRGLGEYSKLFPVAQDPYVLELRPWQAELRDALLLEADDRTIHFVVDPHGCSGKSKLAMYMCRNHGATLLRADKYADLAHAYNGEPILFFDIPRAQRDPSPDQYRFAEEVKDGCITKTKYESKTIWFKPPHVVFLSNYDYDHTKWSDDRVISHHLSSHGFSSSSRS